MVERQAGVPESAQAVAVAGADIDIGGMDACQSVPMCLQLRFRMLLFQDPVCRLDQDPALQVAMIAGLDAGAGIGGQQPWQRLWFGGIDTETVDPEHTGITDSILPDQGQAFVPGFHRTRQRHLGLRRHCRGQQQTDQPGPEASHAQHGSGFHGAAAPASVFTNTSVTSPSRMPHLLMLARLIITRSSCRNIQSSKCTT